MRLLPFFRRAAHLGLFSLVVFSVHNAEADSATWNLNPDSSNWNTATNWTPNTVPNGPADVATFAASNTTAVSLSADTTLDSIVFSPGASAFTISTAEAPLALTISGVGVINDSGVTQTFVIASQGIFAGLLFFTGEASAGNLCSYNATASPQGYVRFFDEASAGTSTFVASGGLSGYGSIVFSDNSTAASGTFSATGSTNLSQAARAAKSFFTIRPPRALESLLLSPATRMLPTSKGE